MYPHQRCYEISRVRHVCSHECWSSCSHVTKREQTATFVAFKSGGYGTPTLENGGTIPLTLESGGTVPLVAPKSTPMVPLAPGVNFANGVWVD